MHRYTNEARTNSYEFEYTAIKDLPFINKCIALCICLLVAMICVLNVQMGIQNGIDKQKTSTSILVQETSKIDNFTNIIDFKLQVLNDTEEVVKKAIAMQKKSIAKKQEQKLKEKEVIKEKPKYKKYKATEDDTFWSMAEKFYGDGKYCIHILLANNLDIEDSSCTSGKKYKIPVDINKKVTYDSYLKEMRSNAEKEYIGDFKITGYDIYCSHCCGGKSDGITSSGVPATIGKTIALNKNYHIPYGTTIYIEDYGYYTLEDSGLAEGYVDIACDSHDDCFDLTSEGLKHVYIVKV